MTQLNTWFRDETEEQSHITMIANPRQWPWAVFLPMKHPERMQALGDHMVGTIKIDEPLRIIFSCGHHEDFESPEAMVAAGWVVD